MAGELYLPRKLDEYKNELFYAIFPPDGKRKACNVYYSTRRVNDIMIYKKDGRKRWLADVVVVVVKCCCC